MMESVPVADWQTYLRWHTGRAAADWLSSPFAAESFNFSGRVLTGALEQRPRWKRSLQLVDGSIGEALGQLYVAGDHVPVVFRVGTDNRVFTVAGTTDTGNSGDGGPALQARLTSPFGALPTNDGGFYISDADAHVIRYVDPAGIIHTVAGTGERGYSGDGGPAIEAKLKGPTRMRLDAGGNLYFCETTNHVIRRLDKNGTISTVAGTGEAGYSGDGALATEAKLYIPYDLRFSPDGDLYVADTGNSVIRRIDHNGVITTVAGAGVAGFSGDGSAVQIARLNGPSGVIFDIAGNLWISDTYNHRVRRVAKFLQQQ